MTIKYSVEFYSFWHTGSGLSGGVDAKALTIKTKDGLPFIPGRTIKGLLREATQILIDLESDLVSNDFLETIFGLGLDHIKKEESNLNVEERKGPRQGVCFFGNATLSKYLSETVINNKQEALLFQNIASTAIGNNGQALDQSLRQMEVTVPLTLYGTIERFPDDETYKKQLEYCFNWVKKMGANRNRGMGRCQFTLLD